MRTARALTIQGGGVFWGRGPAQGSLPRGCLSRGVPCDLSHHAFDVTYMLSQHQLSVYTNAAAYIVVVGHVTQVHAGVYTPVNRMTDRCKNITFLQLRLRAVII